MTYTPSKELLTAYANILVTFALNSGEGVKPGELVNVVIPECAKPIYEPLRDAIREAGAMMHLMYTPDNTGAAEHLMAMSDAQLQFFPGALYKGMVDSFDHQIVILADANPREYANVEPDRLMKRQQAMLPYRQWRDAKEAQGKFTWTLALYGTEAMAQEAGLTLEAYWQQIIDACYLSDPDPVASWRQVANTLEDTRTWLNSLGIEWVTVEAPGTDIRIKLGEGRAWLGGSGRNIPSFELFTSPDCRYTEGTISFTEPLYMHGTLITDITLTFSVGRVVDCSASSGKEVLDAMLEVSGANMVGEFSLTDGTLSRITAFMANTLYDENRGGAQGNTHIALGNAYRDAYTGNPADVSEEEWTRLGYNRSAIHTDIVATSPRTVWAELADGRKLIIYQNGSFVRS